MDPIGQLVDASEIRAGDQIPGTVEGQRRRVLAAQSKAGKVTLKLADGDTLHVSAKAPVMRFRSSLAANLERGSRQPGAGAK